MIATAVPLLVGLALGGYAGYRLHDRCVTSQAVKLMMESSESSQAMQAAMATRAIEMIESGETQKAVQLLCGPIAHYHYLYADRPDTEQRRQTCGIIDQLIRTNRVVAEEITNRMPSSPTPRKAQ